MPTWDQITTALSLTFLLSVPFMALAILVSFAIGNWTGRGWRGKRQRGNGRGRS